MNRQSVGNINSKVFEFEWIIKTSDFTSTANGQYMMSSPMIITYSFDKEIKWCIDLYPKGRNKGYENFVSIFLHSLNSFDLWSEASFFFLNNDGTKVNQCSTTKQLFSKILIFSWGFSEIIEHSFILDPINNLIKDDKITIGIQITIHSILNPEQKIFRRVNGFDNFQKLFLNEKFSDLTVISADKKKLKVYRGILASCSPVFEAMFEHDMVENNQGILNIEDVEYEILLEVFRFMYTAEVNKIETMLPGLLYAAEKYSIEGLKALCEETMLTHLTKNNAVEYLIAADQNNSSSIRSKIIEYIVSRAEDLVNTPEFVSLGHSHFDLVHKIMNGLVSKNKNT